MARPLPRLVLHFDVNETIMVGDPAGGDTFEESLNKICAKCAIVRRVEAGEGAAGGAWSKWRWHDGTPLDVLQRTHEEHAHPPPLLEDFEFSQQPAGCVSFYKVAELKPFAKTFTEAHSPGCIYRGVYEQLECALRCDPTIDSRLCHDGSHHLLVPAFFHTLTALRDAGRRFSLVVRTFGTDSMQVIAAIKAFSEGAHPSYAAMPELADSLRDSPMWKGVYRTGEGGRVDFVLQGDGGEFVCDETSVERALVKPHCPISAACCQDDYEHWSSRGCNPAGGKPVWVTAEDSTEHPIFFDDNIHNSTEDSIVAVRVRPDTSTPHYAALSGQDTLALHGLILVRTPSFAPILDPSWFLRKIEACEQAMLKARTAAAGGGWCPQSARD
jgi:hypothetical protein